MENHLVFNGKIDYKWPFSIAMLVHMLDKFGGQAAWEPLGNEDFEGTEVKSGSLKWIFSKKLHPGSNQKTSAARFHALMSWAWVKAENNSHLGRASHFFRTGCHPTVTEKSHQPWRYPATTSSNFSHCRKSRLPCLITRGYIHRTNIEPAFFEKLTT